MDGTQFVVILLICQIQEVKADVTDSWWFWRLGVLLIVIVVVSLVYYLVRLQKKHSQRSGVIHVNPTASGSTTNPPPQYGMQSNSWGAQYPAQPNYNMGPQPNYDMGAQPIKPPAYSAAYPAPPPPMYSDSPPSYGGAAQPADPFAQAARGY